MQVSQSISMYMPTNVGWALLFLACPSVCPSVRCHSNSVIFNQISSKFHIWIASINFLFKFEYGFCSTSDNQDGQQNGCHLSISAVVVTLAQSFLIGFLPNFIYWLLPSTFLFKFEYGFCSTSNNQDGQQKKRCLSMSAVVVTLAQSLLIGFLPNFMYRLLPSNSCSSLNTSLVRRTIIKMGDKMAAAYQFALMDNLP